MRALVIGGGGYIGRRLTSRLLRENWDVTSLTLSDHDRQSEADGLRLLEGDRDDPKVLVNALAGEPDVVFDLIAYRPTQSQALVNRGAGRIGRLIHLSTVSVYREYPKYGRANETNALRFEGTETGYGPNKAACERVLEQAGTDSDFPFVILRAGQLIGRHDPCSRQGYLVKRILAAQTILHPGPEDGFLWLLFIDDLIEALLRAATASVLKRVFHLAQEEAPTLRDHVAELARGLGMDPPPIRSLGIDSLIELGFRIYGFAFARPIDVPPDATAAREALGWQCTPHRQVIAETLADLCGEGHAPISAWPGRDTTQALLSASHEWIHAAKEARVLAGVGDRPGPDADTVLGWLSDEPFIADRPRLVESEQWCSRFSSSLSPRDSTFVTVPAALAHRLAITGTTWTPSRKRDDEDLRSEAPCDLVASVEWDKWSRLRAWIFTSSPSSSPAHYGFSLEPLRFDFVSLRKGLGMAVSPGERLLLEVRDSEDARTLADFLQACQKRGSLQVDDLANWSRLYIAGAASFLPNELQNADSTGKGTIQPSLFLHKTTWRYRVDPTVWVLTHSVARLLCRAGLEGAGEIKMGSGKLDPVGLLPSLPMTAALCWVGARAVVVDLAARRVIEVAPAIAEILSEQSIE